MDGNHITPEKFNERRMPISNFDGETFVAFTDISGFKEMLKNQDRAIRAIDKFYSKGYEILLNHREIDGIFVSDCGVLFSRNTTNKARAFADLLEVIQELNSQMLQTNVMLKTAIAYGPFSYHQKIEFIGIEKIPFFGNAYLMAFLATEKEKPGIEPGECHIVSKNLPDGLINELQDIKRWRICKGGTEYYNFYWMVAANNDIDLFSQDYQDTYNRKYEGILSVLKKYDNKRLNRRN